MSKGSKPRPLSVSDQEYASRWDAIFQRDLPKLQHEVRNAYFDGLTKGVGIMQNGQRVNPDLITDPQKIREAFEQDDLNGDVDAQR